jgi:hypothetical protein
MADDLVTHYFPYLKVGDDESITLAQPREDGLPLRFQAYFSLCVDSLAQHLASESMKLQKELHETKELLRQAQEKTDRIKKEGAPPGQPAVAYRGGRPPVDAPAQNGGPSQPHRMTAGDYRKLFTVPPAKQRRDELLRSLSSSSSEEIRMDEDEEEDPEEREYVTEHSAT